FSEMWQPAGPVFKRPFCIGLLAMALLGVASPAAAGSGTGRQVHVVYAGQRLGSIAKRYNVSIEAICQANGIRRRDPIHPGQRLEIPSRAEARAMVAAPAGSSSSKGEADPTGAGKPAITKPADGKAVNATTKAADDKATSATKAV